MRTRAVSFGVILALAGWAAGTIEVPTAAPIASAAPEYASNQIEPSVERLDLDGVVASVLGEATAAAPSRLDATAVEGAVDLGGLDDEPEVLASETDVDRFDAVGVSWDTDAAPDNAVVSVRVREQGTWSEWTVLPALDIGPDAGSAEASRLDGRTATEPLVTSGADGIQVRIDADGDVSGVKADLIDAGRQAQGTAGPAGYQTISATTPMAPAATPGLPSGAPARPYFISRAQWGADESLRSHAPEYSPNVKVGVVHHTATSNSYTPQTSFDQVRAIYGYHTKSLGYNDIAYNSLVDRYGQIFEGRAGGLERPVLSAATGGFNQSTFSVSALGNFDEIASPAYMLESISQVLAWKFSVSYVDPLGASQLTSAGFSGSNYPAGKVVTFNNIIGHRDTFPTSCPGADLYNSLDAIRNRVMQLTLAGIASPTLTQKPRTTTTNGSIRVTAGLVRLGDWAVKIFRPDGSLLTYSTGRGRSIDVDWNMTEPGGAPAGNGTYTFTIESVQDGRNALDYRAAASTSGIVGSLDSVRLTPGGIVVSGWSAATNAAVSTVMVVVDGHAITRGPSSQSRPDVGAAFPALGPDRGFTVTPTMGPGVHSICVWGESPGLVSGLLGCQDINAPSNDPFGNVDGVRGIPGGLQVSGWTIDRDSASPISVRLYADGKYAGDALASKSRPDVGNVYPAYGPDHGFEVSVPTGPGSHTVCVNGLNTGPGKAEVFLRCVTGTALSGKPIGNSDSVEVGNNAITVHGWALDPDTTAPIAVHLYIDGAYAGSSTADRQRPDLATAFPGMGTAHGFGASAFTPTTGRHTACVYGINVGAPDVNPLIGCLAFGTG